VVSKPPLRPNSCVGPRDSILEILNIFLRLNPSVRLFIPLGFRRGTLNLIEGFETTSNQDNKQPSMDRFLMGQGKKSSAFK